MTFKTAIIDPPWAYDSVSAHEKMTGYATQQYPVLSEDRLLALPVDEIMDKEEAYIFLWTTGPFAELGYRLLRHWNFVPITQLCWYKNTGLGVGYWFRGDHETVLVAARENAPSISTGERSLFASPRLGHSRKPDTVHEIIEKLREPRRSERKKKDGSVSTRSIPTSFPGPYLELFGRKSRPNWVVLGNAVDQPIDEYPKGPDILDAMKTIIASSEETGIRKLEALPDVSVVKKTRKPRKSISAEALVSPSPVILDSSVDTRDKDILKQIKKLVEPV